MATILSSRLLRHDICLDELKQLGAEVVDMDGVMTFVKFNMEVIDLSYIYHLNKDDSYFLERISPYTVPVGKFPHEEAVIESIRVDVEQFRNAMQSQNFLSFVEIDSSLSRLVKVFEDLFLYYNIEREDMLLVHRQVKELLDDILAVRDRSERVYFKKDPDSI